MRESGGEAPRKILDICAEMSRNLWVCKMLEGYLEMFNVVRVRYEGSGGVAPRKILDICAKMCRNVWFVECG